MTVRRVPVYFEFGSFRGRGGIFLEVLIYIKKSAPLVFLRLQSHWLVYCDSYFQLSTWGASMWPWRSSFFSQERRLDLSMTIILRNHFLRRIPLCRSSLDAATDSAACFCRKTLRRTILDVTECNSQVDALNTSVKWPVTCATITHRLMLVRPVQISCRQAQASL